MNGSLKIFRLLFPKIKKAFLFETHSTWHVEGCSFRSNPTNTECMLSFSVYTFWDHLKFYAVCVGFYAYFKENKVN